MKRKMFLLFAIVVTVSLSACADKPASPVDGTGVGVVSSTVSREESRNRRCARQRRDAIIFLSR